MSFLLVFFEAPVKECVDFFVQPVQELLFLKKQNISKSVVSVFEEHPSFHSMDTRH